MVDVSTKSCEHVDCFKRPTFGLPAVVEGGQEVRSLTGTKNGQFCAQHAQAGMVDVVSKRCEFPGCGTKRSFGEPGPRKNVSIVVVVVVLVVVSLGSGGGRRASMVEEDETLAVVVCVSVGYI